MLNFFIVTFAVPKLTPPQKCDSIPDVFAYGLNNAEIDELVTTGIETFVAALFGNCLPMPSLK